MQSAIFRTTQLLVLLLITVWATPAHAQISADKSSVAFGKVVVGGSAMQNIALSGSFNSSEISVIASGDGFSWAGGCSQYSNCIFWEIFSPTSDGAKSGQLDFKNTTTGATLLPIPLSGESGYPSFSLSVASIDFGAHSLTTPAVSSPLVLTNTGDYLINLSISSRAVDANFASGGGCG